MSSKSTSGSNALAAVIGIGLAAFVVFFVGPALGWW